MIRAKSVVICDTIRKEESGKYILVGVYGENMGVTKTPCNITLSIWIEISVDRNGSTPIELCIRKNKHRNPDVKVGAEINTIDFTKNVFIAFPPAPLHITEPCILAIQLREISSKWKTVRKLIINSRQDESN